QHAARNMKASEETVGQRIKRLREERGWTHRELAAPGCSYAYISRIEKDLRKPSLKVLRILAKKLGVSAQYLETGEKVTPSAERELRLSDAELELRLNRDLERAEEVFRADVERGDEPLLLA